MTYINISEKDILDLTDKEITELQEELRLFQTFCFNEQSKREVLISKATTFIRDREIFAKIVEESPTFAECCGQYLKNIKE